MAEAVVMPRQGQSVESCVITQWLKKKGDQVEEGELLFSYETDKAAFDEQAPVAGTLLEVLYEEGDEVPVLQIVAIIGKPGEDVSDILGGASSGAETDGRRSETEEQRAETEEQRAETEEQRAETEEQRAETDGSAGEAVGLRAETDGPGKETGQLAETDGSGGDSEGQSSSRIRISPRARKMAEAMQVNIAALQGSGPNGRIIADDIEAAGKSRSKGATLGQASISGDTKTATGKDVVPRPAPTYATPGEPFTDQPLSNIRKIIAKNMKASLDNSAQLTHHASADARKILSLRKAIKEGTEQGLPATTTLNDMVCHAIVEALKDTPEMNAHFLGDKTRSFSGVHLGMAVDTPRGLMVPALKNADRFTLGGLGQSLRELAESCKNGSIDPDLLAPEAGSFTVSNLGAFGVEMFTPVLNLPQCGIIGINTIVHRPADMGDGTIGFVPYIGISLTYDHRAVDGAPASRFLQKVCKLIAGFDPKF